MHWVERANCRGANPEWFMPESKAEAAEFVPLCRTFCDDCPVRLECFDRAYTAGEFGVWGGYYFPENKRRGAVA